MSLRSPEHPYTKMLMDSIPTITHRKPLAVFEEEAKLRFSQYLKTPLQFVEVSPDHWVAAFS